MQAIARQKDGSSAATHGPGLQQHCIAGVLQECWKTTKLDITHNARAIPVQDKKNRSCTATDVPGVAALYHQKTTQPDYHPMMARQSEDQKDMSSIGTDTPNVVSLYLSPALHRSLWRKTTQPEHHPDDGQAEQLQAKEYALRATLFCKIWNT